MPIRSRWADARVWAQRQRTDHVAGTQAQAALRLGFLTCQTVCLQLEERRPKSSLQLGLREVLGANRPPANGGNRTFWQVWGPPPPPHQRITSGAPSTAPSPHTLATEALSLRGPQRWAAVPAGPVLGLRQQQAPPVQAAGRTCHLALDARTPTPSSSGSSNTSWLPSSCMPAKGSSVLRRSPARQTLSPAVSLTPGPT